MYKVTTALVVSLLLFVGISTALALKWELKFEAPDVLDYFKAINDGTRAEKGEWVLKNGALHQLTDNVKDDAAPGGPSGKDPAAGGYFLLKDSKSLDWKDYTVSADFIWTDDDWWGIMFYYTDGLNYYRYRVEQRDSVEKNQNPAYKLEKFVKGAYKELVTGEIDKARIPDAVKDKKEEYHNLKVNVRGGSIEIFFDNKSLKKVSDADLAKGTIAFYMTTNTGWIDNLVVDGEITVAVEPAGKLSTTWAGIKADF